MSATLFHGILICLGTLALWLLVGFVLIWRGHRNAPIYNDGKEH